MLGLGLAVTQHMLGTPAGSCCLWACPSHPREKGVRPPCWGGPEPCQVVTVGQQGDCLPGGGGSSGQRDGVGVGVLGARRLLATLLEGSVPPTCGPVLRGAVC